MYPKISEVLLGHSTVFKCIARTALVSWSFKGKPIQSSSDSGILLLENVLLKDAGIYICHESNNSPLGDVNYQVTLKVFGELQP